MENFYVPQYFFSVRPFSSFEFINTVHFDHEILLLYFSGRFWEFRRGFFLFLFYFIAHCTPQYAYKCVGVVNFFPGFLHSAYIHLGRVVFLRREKHRQGWSPRGENTRFMLSERFLWGGLGYGGTQESR